MPLYITRESICSATGSISAETFQKGAVIRAKLGFYCPQVLKNAPRLHCSSPRTATEELVVMENEASKACETQASSFSGYFLSRAEGRSGFQTIATAWGGKAHLGMKSASGGKSLFL